MKIAWTMITAAAAGSAQAGIYLESESNNTIPTANVVGTVVAPGDSWVIDGSITPGGTNLAGDVDWFAFDLPAGSTFVAAGYALSVPNSQADGQFELVNSSGVIVAFDDDGNLGLMPSIQANGLPAGRYYLGISGFDDLGSITNPTIFDGIDGAGPDGHTENWTYKLVVGVNVIPAPGSVALVGAGVLGLLRRRR